MKQYQIISETKNNDGSVESGTVRTSTRKRDINTNSITREMAERYTDSELK